MVLDGLRCAVKHSIQFLIINEKKGKKYLYIPTLFILNECAENESESGAEREREKETKKVEINFEQTKLANILLIEPVIACKTFYAPCSLSIRSSRQASKQTVEMCFYPLCCMCWSEIYYFVRFVKQCWPTGSWVVMKLSNNFESSTSSLLMLVKCWKMAQH